MDQAISVAFGVSYIMRRNVVAALVATFAIAPALAQEKDGSVPLFCRDNSGQYQPFVRTDYARLQGAFERQFGWQHVLQQKTPSTGILQFSVDAKPNDPERISYDVQPFNGGIALLHMHVRLRGMREDLSGTEMCMRTFGIVNVE